MRHVLALDLVGVVQSCLGNGDTADVHGLEDGERSDGAGSADVHVDVVEDGGLLLRRELECDRPPRCLGRVAEVGALGEVVHLDDGSVDLVIDLVPPLLRVGAVRLDSQRSPGVRFASGCTRRPIDFK